MIEYVRVYTPDLAGWFTNFGQVAALLRRQRPLRPRPADVPADRLPGGTLTALDPSPASSTGFRDQRQAPLSGRRDPAAAGRLGARSRSAAATPTPPAHEAADLHLPARGHRALDRDRHVARVDRRRHARATTRCARSSTTPPTLVAGEDVKVAGAPVGVVEEHGRHRRQEGGGHAADRRRGLHPVQVGRALHDPAPGADRREVRGVRAGHRRRPRALGADRERRRRGRATCCRSRNTSSPVDLDLLNNILRLPYRQRFAILLNELGTGLAGRGDELNEVIHRANPALRETDKVLRPRRAEPGAGPAGARLRRGARPARARARARRRTASSRRNATGEATAERSGDIALGSTAARLPARAAAADGRPRGFATGHAGAGRPRRRGAELAELIKRGRERWRTPRGSPFPSLGDALERGPPGSDPRAPAGAGPGAASGNQARAGLRGPGRPLTASLEKTEAIERLNDFLYYLALTTNGFDSRRATTCAPGS